MEAWRDELYHHGILKQKWGVRNGPPYPLSGGDYSKAEKNAIYRKRLSGNSIYNKKHFDKVLDPEKTTLSTLSYDKNRLKDTDMFYASVTKLDKHLYNAVLNKPIKKPVYDEDGNLIGYDNAYKYRLDSKLKGKINVASEDSSAKIFMNLYKNDRDFYNFVNDENRMESYFIKSKFAFKGYRESKAVLDKMKDESYTPTEKDLKIVYRMFNYVIPYDGAGNKWNKHDIEVQRAKFFRDAKKEGYGAILDTNDAIYNHINATLPVIVFDMGLIIPKETYQTKLSDKRVSTLVLVGRKALGV